MKLEEVLEVKARELCSTIDSLRDSGLYDWTDKEFLRFDEVKEIVINNVRNTMDYTAMFLWEHQFNQLLLCYSKLVIIMSDSINKKVMWETLCTCLSEMPIVQRYSISQFINTIPEFSGYSLSDFVKLDFEQATKSNEGPAGILRNRGVGIVTFSLVREKFNKFN